MFTGIVQDIGVVERLSPGSTTDLWVRTQLFAGKLERGESIAIDGACLTVVESAAASFKVQATPETMRRTTLGMLNKGSRVNLERAMRLDDRLGGHLVLGHVDAVTEILDIKREGGSIVLGMKLPVALAGFFIEKGSVAIDGISLTINSLTRESFSVALIPETQERTTLAEKKVGTKVNVEADLIGKYVARLLEVRSPGSTGSVSEDQIRSWGFGS